MSGGGWRNKGTPVFSDNVSTALFLLYSLFRNIVFDVGSYRIPKVLRVPRCSSSGVDVVRTVNFTSYLRDRIMSRRYGGTIKLSDHRSCLSEDVYSYVGITRPRVSQRKQHPSERAFWRM